MYKTIIISTASSLVAAFIGKIAYDLSCKPDGYEMFKCLWDEELRK